MELIFGSVWVYVFESLARLSWMKTKTVALPSLLQIISLCVLHAPHDGSLNVGYEISTGPQNRLDIFRRHVSKVKDECSSSPLVISNLPALLPSPESCNQTLHGILHSTSLELSNLEHGTNLYKIRHKGKMRGLCWYKRQFTLNLDSSGLGEVTQDSTKIQRRNNFRLFCLDPIPDQLRFNLNEISNILPGQQTRTFKKLVKLTDKKEMVKQNSIRASRQIYQILSVFQFSLKTVANPYISSLSQKLSEMSGSMH